MVEERRGSCRVPFDGRAYLTYAGRCRSEAVVDISKNGMQLSSGARLKPGREVKVFLPLPSRRGWRLCLLKGEVARRARGAQGAALGIKLSPDAIDTRALLADYVARAG
jgi:hypothetical protein